jgi:hypothetical protein
MGHETGSQRIRPSSAGPAPENAEEAAASRTNGTVNLRDIAASARELLARTVELSYSKRDLLETLNEYRGGRLRVRCCR